MMTFHEFLAEACPPLDLEWRKYRRRASGRQIWDRIRALGLPGYEEYLARLREDPFEAAGLADRMRVTVTRFFRERERWEVMVRIVLPRLAEEAAGSALRAWSVGCCGGEEPYTFAILWRESFPGRRARDARLAILASDIDENSLARAGKGLYLEGTLKEVPPGWRGRYFREEDGLWRLAEEVKEMVAFSRRDLMTDPPPEGMDLVFCRYLVFTYYRGERRESAARILHRALRPGGALMIGRKENLQLREDLFEPWPGAEGVFIKPG